MIVADWGTTNLRVYACDDHGAILGRVESPQGIKSLSGGGYPAALARAIALLEGDAGGPVFVCGMASSRNGWIETPYCTTPLALEGLAAKLVPLPDPFEGYILPGASTRLPDGTRDVMRGEEIQIFGATAQLGLCDGVLCLPGTHSKWAHLSNGKLAGFATFMTGDLFQALSQTILACDVAAPHCPEAFTRGLQSARDDAFGLLHQLFAARMRVLDGTLEPEQISAFVSGLLIGRELAEAQPWLVPEEPVTIIAAEGLCRLYSAALDFLGQPCLAIDASMATCAGVAGLRDILSGGN
jgi:2-dehydro-3-deoxygalactonokinase